MLRTNTEFENGYFQFGVPLGVPQMASLAAYSPPEFPSRSEGDHTAGGDRDFLLGFRVTPRTLPLVMQIEITEPG